MTIIDLLKKLVEMKGSDLHLLAGLHPAVRVDGELIPLTDYERFTPDGLQFLLYSILTDEQRETFEHDKDFRYELDFAYGVAGLGRFRINIHKQRGTTAASVRALSARIPQLADLGLPDSVRLFTKAKRGLVLVTGPTGCGKSTTLAALIDDINSHRNEHVVTIEDPVEYIHKSKKAYVSQREVGPAGDTLSFKNALRSALRQDPDVILIGEMRDFETIGIALTSAETGHLVFGTLHTSSAAQTVDRIVDVFPAEQQPQVRVQLASNLLGVVSQVLLPRVDQPGRCLASEVMMCNFAIRNNIRMGKSEAIIQTLQTGLAEGMQTMDQSLLRLCKEGKIDYEIAKPYIYDKSTHETLKKFARRSAPHPAEAGAVPRPSPGQPPWERKI